MVHDRLTGPELLHEARAGAELVDVGKGAGHAALSQEEINRLLVVRARSGRDVVRLKGGDPFVFGRGSEELAACRTAGRALRSGAGREQRDRRAGGGGDTGHRARRRPLVRRGDRTPGGRRAGARGGWLVAVDTIVVLMGRSSLPAFTARLIEAGRDPHTPAACIQSATTPAQRVALATLATIAEAAEREGLEAPVVTVIGEVARMASEGVVPVGIMAAEIAALGGVVG